MSRCLKKSLEVMSPVIEKLNRGVRLLLVGIAAMARHKFGICRGAAFRFQDSRPGRYRCRNDFQSCAHKLLACPLSQL